MENLLYQIDWTAVHVAVVLNDHGGKVLIHADGSHSVLDSGLSLRGKDDIIAALPCTGTGNIDTSLYAQGWAEKHLTDEGDWDGRYRTRNGRILSLEEMLEESIKNGEWSDLYDDWREDVERQWKETLEARKRAQALRELEGQAWAQLMAEEAT